MKHFVLGDIGGTNCRLAISTEQGEILFQRNHSTHDMSSIVPAVEELCAEQAGINVIAGAVAVAGPVHNGEASLTNGTWSIAQNEFAFPCRVLNDLEAAAEGVLEINAQQCHMLMGQYPLSEQILDSSVVVGLGTGVGQGLIFNGRVYPTEGGHIDFAPFDSETQALCAWLRPQVGRIRMEDLLSGMGIERIWTYVKNKYESDLESSLDGDGPHPGSLLVNHAGEDLAAQKALELYASIAGSHIGNLILQNLPKGGVWICGGVAQKMRPVLDTEYFRAAVINKSPMQHLLTKNSIGVVTHPDVGLLGSLRAAKNVYEERSKR